MPQLTLYYPSTLDSRGEVLKKLKEELVKELQKCETIDVGKLKFFFLECEEAADSVATSCFEMTLKVFPREKRWYGEFLDAMERAWKSSVIKKSYQVVFQIELLEQERVRVLKCEASSDNL